MINNKCYKARARDNNASETIKAKQFCTPADVPQQSHVASIAGKSAGKEGPIKRRTKHGGSLLAETEAEAEGEAQRSRPTRIKSRFRVWPLAFPPALFPPPVGPAIKRTKRTEKKGRKKEKEKKRSEESARQRRVGVSRRPLTRQPLERGQSPREAAASPAKFSDCIILSSSFFFFLRINAPAKAAAALAAIFYPIATRKR
jgi:hypothetical protein